MILAFFLGCLFTSCVVFAESYFKAKDITYDNSSSGMKATNTQDALDEIYNIENNKVFSQNTIVNAEGNTSVTVSGFTVGKKYLCIIKGRYTDTYTVSTSGATVINDYYLNSFDDSKYMCYVSYLKANSTSFTFTNTTSSGIGASCFEFTVSS